MEQLTRADVEGIVRQHLSGTTAHVEGLQQKLVGLRSEFERAIERIGQRYEVDTERAEDSATRRAQQHRQLWSAIDAVKGEFGREIDDVRRIAETARDAAGG